MTWLTNDLTELFGEDDVKHEMPDASNGAHGVEHERLDGPSGEHVVTHDILDTNNWARDVDHERDNGHSGGALRGARTTRRT